MSEIQNDRTMRRATGLQRCLSGVVAFFSEMAPGESVRGLCNALYFSIVLGCASFIGIDTVSHEQLWSLLVNLNGGLFALQCVHVANKWNVDQRTLMVIYTMAFVLVTVSGAVYHMEP